MINGFSNNKINIRTFAGSKFHICSQNTKQISLTMLARYY